MFFQNTGNLNAALRPARRQRKLTRMSPYAAMLLIGFAGAVFGFAMIWYLQLRLGDASVVDVLWSLSIGAIGTFYCLVADGNATRRFIAGMLILLWALRPELLSVRSMAAKTGRPSLHRSEGQVGRIGAAPDADVLSIPGRGGVSVFDPHFFGGHKSRRISYLGHRRHCRLADRPIRRSDRRPSAGPFLQPTPLTKAKFAKSVCGDTAGIRTISSSGFTGSVTRCCASAIHGVPSR